MKYFSFTLIFLTLFITNLFNSYGQSIEGTLQNYDGKAADIVTGMREPIVIGEINEKGKFKIPLNKDYLNKVKSSIAAENSDNDQWTTRLMSIERAFGNCEGEKVKITNGDQPLMKLSTFNSFSIIDLEAKERYGYFMAASSEDFAEALNMYEPGNDQKGYILDWYYFEKPAMVKGSCAVETYTLSQNEADIYQVTTTYDLDLKPGWNLVKFGYADLHQDSDGKKYVNSKIYNTIDAIPPGTDFFYFPE